MALMMDNAFEAANTKPRSFNNVPQIKKQWMALLKALVPKGGELAELIGALKRDSAKNTRVQFLDRLQLISKRMPESGRAIFIIDPAKKLLKESDQSWAIVVRDLPAKIKFIFTQRTDDVLVESETFGALDNVSRIPQKTLGALDEEAVEKLLLHRAARLNCDIRQLHRILDRYEGHPYALQNTLDLLEAGTKLEELPQDPTGIAPKEWKDLCKRSRDAIRLFKTYAILEVGVPDEVVTSVSELDIDTLQSLLADDFLGGRLREEGYGKRIYHAILADHISTQMGDSEKRQYHSRAVACYREKLKDAREKQITPDALSTNRLAEHVLASGGEEAFVSVFIDECYGPLTTLGLLDNAIDLSERALGYVGKDSDKQAAIRSILGIIYGRRGDLDKAEQMLIEALDIYKRLGTEEAVAAQYGNLGLVYQTRSDFEGAAQMHSEALEIYEKLGHIKGIADQCSNLGEDYRMRGDLVNAEQMNIKALEIYEKLGWLEGMAIQYGNLGAIYGMRGNPDKAERMLIKALEINEKLGRLEGMAVQYGNLGSICTMRGDLDKAEQMHRKALKIEEKLGRLEGMANQYRNLGLVYQEYGDLTKAEQMHIKALDIDKELGRLEGIASQYGNLGLISRSRGDAEKARNYWEKALRLFKKINMKSGIQNVQELLDDLNIQ